VSGLELVGDVPSHWSVKPLRLLGRLLKGTGGSKEDAVEDGVPCVRYGELYTTHRNFVERALTFVTPERAKEYTPIEYGDVLFAASGETIEEIGKSAVNLLHGAVCGGDLVILRPTQQFSPRFLGYATDAAPVAAQKSLGGRGSTVMHVYPDELREVLIPVPPLEHQQLISDFLDRETARLDALIAAKQRVLDLLAEKRRAIIATAVTRGLEPKVKLRDSGVPWLGEIPAHWQINRVKFLASISYGLSQPPSYFDTGLAFVRATNVKNGGLSTEGLVYVDEASLSGARAVRLQEGDLIVVRSGAYTGDSAYVDGLWAGSIAGFDMVARPNDEIVDARFLAHVLRSSYVVKAQIDPLRVRAAQPHINAEELGSIVVMLPSIEEQRAIVKHITRESAKLDAVRAATERTIALLKERRSALIAAAVTGQLTLGVAA
jgi:type I restriction enzyme, S subunit